MEKMTRRAPKSTPLEDLQASRAQRLEVRSPPPPCHLSTCHVMLRHRLPTGQGAPSDAAAAPITRHSARSQEKLFAASQLRAARLEGVCAKAAATSAKVEEARAREDAAAAERRDALFARLRRAELWRKECLAARAQSQAAVRLRT